jgi:capsular polysaccharide biosynthesis protein
VPHQTQEAAVSSGDPTNRARVGLVLSVLLVGLLAAAAGLGSAALERDRPTRYVSHAVLLIDQEPALSVSHDDGIFNKLSRLRVKYVDTVQTIVFADQVSQKVGIPTGRTHAALSATAAPFSLLLSVQASDNEAVTARLLAQTAAQTLQDGLTREQAALGIPRADRITLTLVSPAPPAVKVSPGHKRALAVGAIVGLAVLGGGLVVVAAAWRRRRYA